MVDPIFTVHPNNSVSVAFVPPADPEEPSKKIKDFVIRYTSDEPVTEDTDWKELKISDPEDIDGTVVTSEIILL